MKKIISFLLILACWIPTNHVIAVSRLQGEQGDIESYTQKVSLATN